MSSPNKRPSVFADIIKPVTATAPTKAEVHASEVAAKGEAEMFRTSLYLSRNVHDKLREIAFHERKKVNDLFMEGLNKVLAARGFPTTDELKAS
jgi:hypothetical protein